MVIPTEFAPGLWIRGFTPPQPMRAFKLIAFGIDSALLYPGAEELVEACRNAGMAVDLALGEVADGDEKLRLLQQACAGLNIGYEQTIVVGRAASDLPMLRVAGLATAFLAPPAVAEVAAVAISTGGMDRLLELLSLHVAEGPPPLDLGVLDALVGHDAAKFRKFAQLFMDSVETVMQAVDDAIAQHDLATLAAMGHRAKSTAMNIGALEFSKQCLLLEKTAKAQEADAALATARTLRPMFSGICQAIKLRLES